MKDYKKNKNFGKSMKKKEIEKSHAPAEGHLSKAKGPESTPNEKEGKIKELESALEKKTEEAEENYQRLLRAHAELDNFKKRTEREKSEAIKYSNEKLIKDILPVLDNLERALHHSKEPKNSESLRDGVKMVMVELLNTLKKFGLEQVHSLGEKFDPNKHEALSVHESSEHDESTIIEEFQKAYFLKDKLLRPAAVSVSKLPKE